MRLDSHPAISNVFGMITDLERSARIIEGQAVGQNTPFNTALTKIAAELRSGRLEGVDLAEWARSIARMSHLPNDVARIVTEAISDCGAGV
jgi:hypothetical protein